MVIREDEFYRWKEEVMAKKKTKFKQLAEHILAGGFVSQPAMVDLDMFRTKIKPI